MISKLRTLQAEIDAIRSELGVSDREEVLNFEPRNGDREIVVVVADGFGGATTKLIEGNYPIDFFTHEEKEFTTESAALDVAQSLSETNGDPAALLR